MTSDSKVLAILKSGAMVNSAVQGDTVRIYLDQTPFYAEGGGQIYDTGVIESNGFKANVKAVSKQNGAFCHEIEIPEGKLSVGDIVSCCVDRVRRNLIARNSYSLATQGAPSGYRRSHPTGRFIRKREQP